MTAEWYLTRATGAVSLILLTVSVALGVVMIGRGRTRQWPRFVIDGVHRTSALLAVAFLVVHIITAVLDSFAPIALVDAFVPFAGAYRPVWLGLGAAAGDLLLAVVITSLLRRRIGHGGWRAVHWMAYAAWPLALVHGLGTGSDVRQPWMLLLDAACLAAVVAAVVTRLTIGWPIRAPIRLTALGLTATFLLGLVIWVPGGPLGRHWAARSGTPRALLAPAAASARKASR